MTDETRQRLRVQLEQHMPDPPTSRARRYYEDNKDLMDQGHHYGGMGMMSTVLLLPVLLPTWTVARIVEVRQRRRARRAFRQRTQRLEQLLDEVRRLGQQPPATRDAYRGSAGAMAALAASPEASFLAQRADWALVLRYAMIAPLPGQPGRTVQGTALCAGDEHGPDVLFCQWADRRSLALEGAFQRLHSSLCAGPPRLVGLEYWVWNRGEPPSLQVTASA